ncbi:MAG: rubrerythrin family protein [Clostridia bacterium]|nr:rubrerythrin family protein [Oscillospiraceae bacterium]MBR4892790.1 rubrerythrin family protein [Clostridia bacterium]
MELKDSKTKVNLLKAFAGESQARNRYTFAASEAKKQKLHIIEEVFTFTANQEKEHAELFYNALGELKGENINIEGGYPVDKSTNILELLKSAIHNENEEYSPVYPEFAKVAKEEGFIKIANLFDKIAEIEKTHAERFLLFANWLEKDKLFLCEAETEWLCLNCGHIHKGHEAPKNCPVCDHNQGYFIRKEYAPYTK